MCVSVCECGFAMVDSRNVISLCAPFSIHGVMEKQKMNDLKRRRNEAGESPIPLLMLHEPEKTSIPVNFLESCFNVFSFMAPSSLLTYNSLPARFCPLFLHHLYVNFLCRNSS